MLLALCREVDPFIQQSLSQIAQILRKISILLTASPNSPQRCSVVLQLVEFLVDLSRLCTAVGEITVTAPALIDNRLATDGYRALRPPGSHIYCNHHRLCLEWAQGWWHLTWCHWEHSSLGMNRFFSSTLLMDTWGFHPRVEFFLLLCKISPLAHRRTRELRTMQGYSDYVPLPLWHEHIEAETKWPPFRRRHFKHIFVNVRILFNFHWNLFLRVQLTILQHWFR